MPPPAEPEPSLTPPPTPQGDNELAAFANVSLHDARSVIGIDAGARTLKLVHLEARAGRVHLVSTLLKDIPPPSAHNRATVISSLVALFVSQARPRITAAHCILSGEGVGTLCCSMPRMDEKDLAQAVRWKTAENGTPDTATVAHYTLPSGQPAPNLDVVVAFTTHVAGMDAIFPSARPRLAVMTTEHIAAENLIRATCNNRYRGPVAVLDIGAASSKLAVITPRGLEFTRDIPVGGDSVTAALAGKVTLDSGTIDITPEIAEEIKKHYTIGQAEPVHVGHITLPANRIIGLIRPVLERLAFEVVRSLQFYSQSHALAKVSELILCGGGALLGGLPPYLSKEARTSAQLLDPWHNLGIVVPPNHHAASPVFAAATGAAIHDRRRINLLPQAVKARKTFLAVRKTLFVAMTFAILAVVHLSWTTSSQKHRVNQTLVLKQTSTQPMENLAAKISELAQCRADLARRESLFASLGVGKPLYAGILNELSNIMPDGTYLKSLSFTKTTGVRKIRLLVDVYSVPGASAARLKQQLVRALEDSAFFTNVSFSSLPTNTAPRQPGMPDDELDLTCQVLGFPGE